MSFYDLIWLVPIFPLVGAAFNGLVSNRLRLEKKVTHSVALIASGLAWLWGWAAVIQWYLTEDITKPYVVELFTWISGGELAIFGGRVVPLESLRPRSRSTRCRLSWSGSSRLSDS